MSLSTARPGILGQPSIMREAPYLSINEFYALARTGAEKEPGLLHGETSADGSKFSIPSDVAVCALGAAIKACGDKTYLLLKGTQAAMEEVQEYNDSMPDVAPEVRKERVIGFLDAKIAALKVAP